MGQSRGAQSGEADRHAVWLEANGLEPKMSPFDPMAILDEIQRLVPGYDVSRMDLTGGQRSAHDSDRERAWGFAKSRTDRARAGQSVQFGHAGPIFPHFEFGN